MSSLTTLLSAATLFLMTTSPKSRKFSAADVPSQTGRTFVVTGANSGIGRIAAGVLATKGARVILAVRNLVKGQDAADTMTGDVEVRRLDLSDLTSIREFAANFTDPIDVLINNAGVMIPPFSRTADGFELQFGTNHLGHFALTNLLLPQIKNRVVTVSSNGHKMGTIDFADLNYEHKRYRAMPAYAQSKLANLLFTSELQQRLTDAGSPVIATAAHPGFAATNLLRIDDKKRVLKAVAGAVTSFVGQGEEVGALPTLYASVTDIPGNSYVGPSGFMEQRGAPELVGRSAKARDTASARRLWEVSETLTGVTFPALKAA